MANSKPSTQKLINTSINKIVFLYLLIIINISLTAVIITLGIINIINIYAIVITIPEITPKMLFGSIIALPVLVVLCLLSFNKYIKEMVDEKNKLAEYKKSDQT